MCERANARVNTHHQEHNSALHNILSASNNLNMVPDVNLHAYNAVVRNVHDFKPF